MPLVSLLSPVWRCVAGTFVTIAVATLPACFAAMLVLPPVPLPVMIRSFVVGTAIPAIVAWAIVRAFRGSAVVSDGTLRLQRADLTVEVPVGSIGAARAWWVPLPMPGITLPGPSGRRLPVAIATGDPAGALALLRDGGADVARALANPTVIAAATRRRRGWLASALKFAGLGTIPAVILLYTHQHIAYGGPFGQWYLESPAAYLATLGQYWATTVILLVSYASCWRIAGELLVWMAAWAGAAPARRMRQVVEAVCAAAYYGGVPAFLALRYLA